MSALFLVDRYERSPDPSSTVVAKRLLEGPPAPGRLDRQEVLEAFDLTGEEFDALKGGRRGLVMYPGKRQYDEILIARVLNWHGPLPSEVAWFREMRSKPETYDERRAVYRGNPDEWVYRCYHGAELVYVGVTRTGINRIAQHMEHAEWLRHVTCIEVEHFASRDESERREAELIARFAPRFNLHPGHRSLLKEGA